MLMHNICVLPLRNETEHNVQKYTHGVWTDVRAEHGDLIYKITYSLLRIYVLWILLQDHYAFQDRVDSNELLSRKLCPFPNTQQDWRCVGLEA